MKDDIVEDLKYALEIKKQKEERKRTKEAMTTWKYGEGLKKEEGDKGGIRG